MRSLACLDLETRESDEEEDTDSAVMTGRNGLRCKLILKSDSADGCLVSKCPDIVILLKSVENLSVRKGGQKIFHQCP